MSAEKHCLRYPFPKWPRVGLSVNSPLNSPLYTTFPLFSPLSTSFFHFLATSLHRTVQFFRADFGYEKTRLLLRMGGLVGKSAYLTFKVATIPTLFKLGAPLAVLGPLGGIHFGDSAVHEATQIRDC